MAHDVFISHSEKDKVTADAVCAMLEANGVRCWIAPRDVLPSMEWSEAIIDAIEECRIMVLVFTANANASSQIRREVERAVNRGVAILPLRIEDVLPGKGLEYFIGNVHWLDALTPPFESHLKNLAGTIKILLARAEPRNTPPTPQPAEPGTAPTAESSRLAESRPTAAAPEVPYIPQPVAIGKPSEQPESGARIFGEWQSGGGTIAEARWQRVPVWAWALGGGVALALLLVAVFAAGHFTSHSIAAVPPSAAPEPVQSSPGAGGPSGTAPAAPAASPMPRPAPGREVIRTTTVPGGVAPAAPTATPPTTPKRAASMPPTLEETMETLREEVNSIGTVSFTVFGKDSAAGTLGQYFAVNKISAVVADSAQCRVSYHWTVWRNGAAQPLLDKDSAFGLRHVTSVVVEPHYQYTTENNASSGHANLVAISDAPPMMSLVILSPGSVNELPFESSALANRTANTLTQAVRLCGGHLAN
jgi:hypothetical protein